MVKNRRANAVLFGFDFQRNAAIILMLERIKELRSVRLEGNEEDIELTLENGKKILAQAKAVEKSSSDFSHVRENLKKALISLSEGAQRVDAQELIFITNSPNPFNDEASRSVFGGLPTHRSFSSLPPSAQVTVQKYLGNIEHPLDSEKFTVQVFPFETDNEAERYKAVTQAMNDFIGSLNVNVSYGLGKWLLQVWHDEIFINGAKKDASIQLRKKDIIWPILVYETDINRCDAEMENRKRNIQMKFYVTEEEKRLIDEKMKQLPIKQYGAYFRKMAIDGYILVVDRSDTKAYIRELQAVSRNINQIAKRANATGTVYRQDIEDIKKAVDEIWRLQRRTLLNQP